MLDPIGDRTINDLLSERADSHGDRTFLVVEDRDGAIAEYTYAEFERLVRRCAAGLHELGVGPGQFVVIHLVNRPELLIAWFAAARLGAAMAPSNVANTAGELQHILEVTESPLVVTETALADVVDRRDRAGRLGGAGRVVGRSAGSQIPFEQLTAQRRPSRRT